MTKRDRISFALRRLRELKAQGNLNLRAQESHRIIKEVIDELSKGTKNADLGIHIVEMLDELYDQHSGRAEGGRISAPPVMPDYTEQIRLHLQTLQAIASDDAHARRAETAAVLQHMLSLFAHGRNAQPMQAFIATFEELIQREHSLPLPVPDYSDQLQPHIDALEALRGRDDPDSTCNEATLILCQALSVFAQGPNEPSILTLLAAFEAITRQMPPLALEDPDYTEQIRPHIETLMTLDELDDPDAVTATAAMALYETLSVFSHGPNAAPIRALLDTFDKVTGAE